MARHTSLSGFPEWLPSKQLVEDQVLDHLRRSFEIHGFSPVVTRAVEPVEQLLSKGETSKEIYLLSRLQAEENEDAQLGLHFDHTVPLARYVVENAGHLTFPFKRYAIGRVWRGERPQEGRFREFIQADVDVVGDGQLALHHDLELPLVMADALGSLPLPKLTIHTSNRKIAQGFYEAIGIADIAETLRIVDKLDKIGPKAVAEQLVQSGTTEEQANQALALAEISGGVEVADRVLALGARSELLDEGLDELVYVLEGGQEMSPGSIVADLKIARGLDYYTGTVYESLLEGHEDLGAICSGGRYDSLASSGKKTYPGVGLSIGVSRILSRMISSEALTVTRQSPTTVLVAVLNEDQRRESELIARALRARGIATDVSPGSQKLGKQIRYADRRTIPYVWFPDSGEVKDIRSGEQIPADPETWVPAREDMRPILMGEQ
ncbi:MAG: histidine--tRNA ligase [Flaviflexus sp.]|nr:histidine--tRNA ligase [Flaviflexus sp.]